MAAILCGLILAFQNLFAVEVGDIAIESVFWMLQERYQAVNNGASLNLPENAAAYPDLGYYAGSANRSALVSFLVSNICNDGFLGHFVMAPISRF
jgi:hypothetical protein